MNLKGKWEGKSVWKIILTNSLSGDCILSAMFNVVIIKRQQATANHANSLHFLFKTIRHFAIDENATQAQKSTDPEYKKNSKSASAIL